MHFAIFTMVGPGAVDTRRLRTMLASLFRHEPNVPLLVVINDSGTAISVDDLVPNTSELIVLSKATKPTIHDLSRNTLMALRCLANRPDVEFVVKIDTDALVIAPFAGSIRQYFVDHPEVGQIGRAERRCDGELASFGVYVPWVRRLKRRIQIARSPKWHLAQAFYGKRAWFRTLVRSGSARGVPDGLHCQGGAYALSNPALRRLTAGGLIENDWAADVCGLAEDFMTSTLVLATGMRLASLTAPGEPFGVEAIGLPMPPAECLAKGYALIHSVKNDPDFPEAEVIRFFEAHDAARANQIAR